MSGRYRTIVADPPWETQPTKTGHYARGVAEAHYETMPAAGIAELRVGDLADDNAHLYLWVTNPVLTEQRTKGVGPVDVCRAWGFEPKTVITWVKASIGTGFFFRGQTEHVIFAVKGRLPIPPAFREKNVFVAPRGRRSAKPDCFYDLVERVSARADALPRVELFARRARVGGWDYWGDESPGTAEMRGAA